jgi:CRISPR-associated protein Cas1
MSSGWRVLDLTGPDLVTLSAGRGTIIIGIEGTEDHVPAADISLILLGTGVTFTSGVLHRLAQHDVVVMHCDWRGVPYSATHPWSNHSRIGKRQLAQGNAHPTDLMNAWQALTQAKLRGQAAVLHTRKPRFAALLRTLAEEVQPGDPTNVESAGARHYWRHMFTKDFRRDQQGTDRINGFLNYGYGILRGH